jgi:hypothetical protein
VDASDPLLRADLDRLRARIEWNVGSVPVAHLILLAAADEVVGIDIERARVMTLLATAVASFIPDGAEDMSARMAALGDAATAPDGAPRLCARLLAGVRPCSGPAVRPGVPAVAPRLRGVGSGSGP